MGLKIATKAKTLLKIRAPAGWKTRGEIGQQRFCDNVNFVLIDFLLDVHNIGYHPELSYAHLVRSMQYNILNYVKAFPNVTTIVLLLDEQKYVPLGKAPTQGKRKKPLTARERNKILDGGVISNMNPNIEESIDAVYCNEASVKSGKQTAFAVFYERYVRTRELRKDLAVFVTKCMVKLVQSGRFPKHIGLYIDGMTVSTYFSSPEQLFSATIDDEGTPLTKRRSSMSVVNELNCHAHEDDKVIPVCKITWTPREAPLALSLSHPFSSVSLMNSPDDSSSPEEMGMEVRPMWLSRKDEDSELFFGYKGPFQRPNIGESDIKIAYYTRRIAEMLAHNNKKADVEATSTCFVVSSDTDIILILLLNMVNLPYYPSQSLRNFTVALDTCPKGTVREIIELSDKTTEYKKPKGSGTYSCVLNRIVYDNEKESLTGIADIHALQESIKIYFNELHPGVRNPVETLCLMFLFCGSDFVDSRPGIGFKKVISVFDLGGYDILSGAISIRAKFKDLPRAKNAVCGRRFSSTKILSVSIDEKKVLSFFNLLYRYALPVGHIGNVSKSLRKEKAGITSEINALKCRIDKLEKIISGEEELPSTKKKAKTYDWDSVEDICVLEEIKDALQRERNFLEHFLPKKYYNELSDLRKNPPELKEHIEATLGIGKHENEDWGTVEYALKRKRASRVKTKRNSMLRDAKKNGVLEEKGKYIKELSDREIFARFKKSAVSDTKNREELIPQIRRIGWNLGYWLLGPFVCPKETKHLNSMCRLPGHTVHPLISSKNNGSKIDDFFPGNTRPTTRAETPRKRSNEKMSMNGFTRVYEPVNEASTTSPKRRKLKVVLSKNIYPPATVRIDLV